jgi:hypothetical protein
MLTSWLPLMEIPVRLGGLAVPPGGHYWPPQPVGFQNSAIGPELGFMRLARIR